jgi:GNAT superfamily N-acetyltransferase
MVSEQIRQLDQLAARAWPAVEEVPLGGWRLRGAGGTTRRANSVWPLGEPGLALDQAVAAVEAFYAERALPARFYITRACCPSDLDGYLAVRGYEIETPVHVQVAPLSEVLDRLASGMEATTRIGDSLVPEWLDLYCQSEQVSDRDRQGREEILRRIPGRVAFASVYRRGPVGEVGVGTGLGVLVEDWLGIFSMACLPAWRRRGVGTELLRGLAGWGRAEEAGNAFLQVMTSNTPALGLYERAGFQTLYEYHYRTRRPVAA